MVNIAGNAIGHPQSYLGTDNYGNIPKKTTANAVPDLSEYYGSETFLTEALTKEAIKAMDAPIRNNQPFFLHLAHYAVHTPIMADKRFLQKYLDAGLDTLDAKYATLIEGMDKSLGDIMKFLKTKGIDKNTIIIFMSDNGGLSLSSIRGGTKHTQNLPLRAGKGSLYEGGIREPMLVKWPGVVKPGTISDQYLQIQDFYPTILEMAGVKKHTTHQTLDGKSFVNVLKNHKASDTTRALIWHYPNKWTNDTTEALCFVSAIRIGNWKLLYLMREARMELYDLGNDIGEKNDLSVQFPAKTRELATVLTKQLKEWNAQMPIVKKTGKTVPWPDEILR
jgi:arylsulfatase A-like enzyme